MSTVLLETKGQVGLITINRPKALNVFNSQVLADFNVALDQAEKENFRCLIITGAGEKAFVAGADVSQMNGSTKEEVRQFSEVGCALFRRVEQFPVPVIAAINGYALGGGSELAAACDIRIASETAVFALPEVGLGIIPGWNGMLRLARIVGPGLAKEMAYSGIRVNAQRALQAGLVNEVVPREELMDKAFALAERIAGNAPIAVRAAKQSFLAALDHSYQEVAALELDLFTQCFGTRDQKNAMAAFVESRKPEPFTGT